MLCTDAGRRAGLPEESVLDLHAADLRASLQRVAGVTLEHRGVAGFPAVATPAAILGNPGVIAGCCRGHWDKKTEEKVGLPRCLPDSEAPGSPRSLTSPSPSPRSLPESPSPPVSISSCSSRAVTFVFTPVPVTTSTPAPDRHLFYPYHQHHGHPSTMRYYTTVKHDCPAMIVELSSI